MFLIVNSFAVWGQSQARNLIFSCFTYSGKGKNIKNIKFRAPEFNILLF